MLLRAKKLVELEMKLWSGSYERDMVDEEITCILWWNKSNMTYREEKSKKSSFDGTKGPSEPRGPPGDS
ncbi:hypothetical protein Tco_0123137 [Tanacetum coccineum]